MDEHIHEEIENSNEKVVTDDLPESNKDEIIDYLTRQLNHYKVELGQAQAQEQALSRELMTYLILERNSLRQALEAQTS